MTRWAAFAGLAVVSLVLLLALARASQSYVTGGPGVATADARDGAPDPPDSGSSDPHRPSPSDPAEPGPDGTDPGRSDGTDPEIAGPGDPGSADPADLSTDPGPGHRQLREGPGELSPGELAANVAVSQGLFGSLLAAGAWLFEIPPEALGLADRSLSAVALGVGLGVVLYVANEAGAVVADRLGVGADERLRELLAPDSVRGWVVLLGFALPVAAGVEELLFRAALIGALSAGFGLSSWLLAALSSVAFGLAHGAQGRGGVVVAGGLGMALAAAFVLTNSLVVVFVAHYLVNALEFLVHEGPGIEWAE